MSTTCHKIGSVLTKCSGEAGRPAVSPVLLVVAMIRAARVAASKGTGDGSAMAADFSRVIYHASQQ